MLVENGNFVKNYNASEKSKCLLIIAILVKNEIFVKDQNFC